MSLNREPVHGDVWERREARRRLRQLELRESLAKRWEVAVGSLRTAAAELYRRVVGVHPEQRQEFRAALEHIAEHGLMTVEDLIESLRDRYRSNGLGS